MERLSDKFGVKEVMDVTFYNLETYEPVLYIDTLKLSNLENTAEESLARGGRGNPILLTWDYNREANFTIQDALVSSDGLALMTGMDLDDLNPETAEVYEREDILITSNDPTFTVTLKHAPIGENRLFVYDQADGIAGGAKTITGFAGNQFDIAINQFKEVANQKSMTVYYPYTRTSSDGSLTTVTIRSDDFPGYYRIVGDTLMKNARTGLDEPFQLVVERAKVLPGFSLTMEAEGDPSVFDMNIKVMRPVGTADTTMITMTKYSDGS